MLSKSNKLNDEGGDRWQIPISNQSIYHDNTTTPECSNSIIKSDRSRTQSQQDIMNLINESSSCKCIFFSKRFVSIFLNPAKLPPYQMKRYHRDIHIPPRIFDRTIIKRRIKTTHTKSCRNFFIASLTQLLQLELMSYPATKNEPLRATISETETGMKNSPRT